MTSCIYLKHVGNGLAINIFLILMLTLFLALIFQLMHEVLRDLKDLLLQVCELLQSCQSELVLHRLNSHFSMILIKLLQRFSVLNVQCIARLVHF